MEHFPIRVQAEPELFPGSLIRVPSFTCWLLTIRVALVAGLNPTSHDTS